MHQFLLIRDIVFSQLVRWSKKLADTVVFFGLGDEYKRIYFMDLVFHP